MQELDEILIKYIQDNIEAGTHKTIGQIFEHFSNEGYSKEEITNALHEFDRRYVRWKREMNLIHKK